MEDMYNNNNRSSGKTEINKVDNSFPITKNTTLGEHDLIYGPIPMRNTVPIVSEEYNTIFFHVAKVASTEWKRFFTRLAGNPNWCTGLGNIHSQDVNNSTLLSDYSREEAEKMMKSPKWKKAIFVRHPKPRMLSAFLDKSIKNGDYFKKKYCAMYKRHGGGTLRECRENHEDFSFFLKNFTSLPHVKDNMHFRSVYSRIDEKWWPYIDFIGYMENINDDAQTFLKSIHSNIDGVSAWDRIGKSGWGDKESIDCTVAAKSQGQFLGERDPRHATTAKVKMMQYYSRELEVLIEERYAEDLNNPYFEFEPLQLFKNTRKN